MKSTITLFAALVLMVGSAFATEGEEKKSKISVVKWKSQVHQLFYEGTDAKVRVRVLDEEGMELWRGKIKNEKGFALPLNFKRQASGTYQVEVRDSNGTQVKEISVSDD